MEDPPWGALAMRLTTYTDYALRTLMYLALKRDGLATIADIAEAYGISGNHLMKVVHQLGVAGDIETVRGRQGGMRLARRPEEINIGKLVRRMEPDLQMAPCFGNPGICPITPTCVLQQAMDEALHAFLAVLDNYTLADLVGPQRKLGVLLGIDPAKRGSTDQPSSARGPSRAKLGERGRPTHSARRSGKARLA